MNNFIRYWLPIAVLIYLVLALLSAVLGENGAILLCAIFGAAALLSLLVCTLKKLAEVEKKLDMLLKDTYKDSDGE